MYIIYKVIKYINEPILNFQLNNHISRTVSCQTYLSF